MLREGLKFGLRSFFVTLKLVCALWVGCCLWWIGNAQAAICFLPDCGDKTATPNTNQDAEKCKSEGYESFQNRVCHQYSIVEFCPYNSDYIKCNNKAWCTINDYIITECEPPTELFDKCPNGEEMYKECKLNMEDACLAEDPTYVSTCKAGWVIDPDDHCSFSDEFGHCCNTCPGFTTKEEIEAAGGTPVASCESCDGTLYIAGADGYNACEGYFDCQDGCAPDAKTCVSFGVTKCDKCKRCEARCTLETCPYGMDCEYEACTWRYCILGYFPPFVWEVAFLCLLPSPLIWQNMIVLWEESMLAKSISYAEKLLGDDYDYSGFEIAAKVYDGLYVENNDAAMEKKFIDKFYRGFMDRPSVKKSLPTKTVFDYSTDSILSALLPEIDVNMLNLIRYGHKISMAADSII